MSRIKARALTISAVAGIGAIALAGCAGGSGGGDDSAEGTALNYPSFFWADSGSYWQTEHVDEFQAANPDIEITLAPVPFADYHRKMYTDMASGQAPDIVIPYDPEIGQWAREGLLEPLDDCLASHEIDTSELIEVQTVAEYDGSTYGLLYYSNPRVLVYNEALYSAAGLSAPTDIDEFQAAIEALHDESTQTYGFGAVTGSDSPAATYLDIMPIIAGFGGAFVEDGEATATKPETVEALEFIKSNVDAGLLPIGQTQAAYREAFSAGKIASSAVGGFIFDHTREKNPEVAEQLAATPLPFPGGGTVAVNVFLAIPADAENKDVACDFIASSLDEQLQAKTASMITAIPATGVVDEAFLAEAPYFGPILEAAERAVSYAPRGAEDKMADVTQIITSVYQEMLTTGMTAQEAAEKMQTQLESLLG